jgi:hypothetical protein
MNLVIRPNKVAAVYRTEIYASLEISKCLLYALYQKKNKTKQFLCSAQPKIYIEFSYSKDESK